MEIEIDVSFYINLLKRFLKILPILLAAGAIIGASILVYDHYNQVASTVASIHPPAFQSPGIQLPPNLFPSSTSITPTPAVTSTPTVTPIPPDSQMALVLGITTLCKVDSTSDTLQAWSDRVCSVASVDGCKYQYSVFGRSQWDNIQSKKISIPACMVTSSNKIKTMSSSRFSEGEVWHIVVTGAEALDITDKYALIVYDPVNGWRFERLLFDEEAKNLNGQP